MKFFSLRYKLLLILTAFPIIGVGTYVVVARHLFLKDKTSYVYDSNLALTKALATQLDIKLHNIFDLVEISSSLNNSDKISDHEKFEMSNQELNSYSKVTILGNGQVHTDEILSKGTQKITLKNEDIIDLVSSAERQKVATKAVDQSIFVLRKNTKPNVKNVYDLIELDIDGFLGEARRPSVFNVFVISKSGRVLVHPRLASERADLEEISKQLTNYVVNDSNKFGTKEFEQDSLLMSYALVPSGSFYVVSTISKEVAFRAVSDLVYKSLLFFIVIISGGFISAYVLSKKLTLNLVKLTDATEQIAKGNFDINIDFKSRDEIGLLGKGFSFMTTEISRLLKELNDYSKTLEIKVEQRTEELNRFNKMQKALLDSLGQGFMILNKEGQISDVKTRVCDDIFSQDVAGKNFADLLPNKTKNPSTITDWISFLFEEKMPFDDLKDIGPKELENQNKRHISLDYRALRGESETIEGIAVIATDDTNEIMAIKESQRQARLVKMLDKLIRHKNQVIETVLEIEDLLVSSEKTLKDPHIDFKKLFMIFHTIKGNAASFELTKIMEICHHLEEMTSPYMKGQTPTKETLLELQNQFALLKIALADFKNNYSHLLGFFDKENRIIEIPTHRLSQFAEKIKHSPASNNLLPEFYHQFLDVSVKDQLKFLQVVADETAARQEKQIGIIQFVGNDFKVPRDVYSKLFSSFVHIIRNSIVHGIESPIQRVDVGKPEPGLLTINIEEKFCDNGNSFYISFKDDGAGIDVETVRLRLKEKGEVQTDSYTDQQVLQKLLIGNISSKASADLDSGRGIGVAAVYEELTKLGGKVTIVSQKGKGTEFQFEVPRFNDIQIKSAS